MKSTFTKKFCKSIFGTPPKSDEFGILMTPPPCCTAAVVSGLVLASCAVLPVNAAVTFLFIEPLTALLVGCTADELTFVGVGVPLPLVVLTSPFALFADPAAFLVFFLFEFGLTARPLPAKLLTTANVVATPTFAAALTTPAIAVGLSFPVINPAFVSSVCAFSKFIAIASACA